MLSDLRSFSRAFPWEGQPPRIRIHNLTAVALLGGLAGFSLLIYLWAFVAPYNLLDWYQHPRLTLRFFLKTDPLAQWWLVWAFLMQAGLYWLAWRLALQVRGRAAWAIVLSGTVAFSAALLFFYPLDAADIFDNIMHGRIHGVYGANPFKDPPKLFAGDPFFPYVAWKRTPSAYGPIWESLAGGVARLAGDGILANVFAFKLLGVFFLALGLGLVYVILRRLASERALAGVILLAWNPVILYETIANGHNDLAMAVWILAAVWAVLERRYTLAILALWVGVTIKLVPLLLLPLVVIIALRDLPHIQARLRFLGTTALASLIFLSLAYAPIWSGVEGLGFYRRTYLFTSSLPAIINAVLQLSLGLEDLGPHISLMMGLLTMLFVMWQSWRTWRNLSRLAFTQAAFNILIFYLLVTCMWFQQWYTIWPLALAAILPPGHASRLAVLFGFAALLTKHLIFGPLLFWATPRPDRAWLELTFGLTVMIIPWFYGVLAFWLTKQSHPKNYLTGDLYDPYHPGRS
jgi:hypothetical protein